MSLMRKAAVVAISSVTLASGLAAVTGAAASAQTPEAVVLKATPTVRHQLADAFWNHSTDFKRSKVDGPTQVRYGRLGNVYWAIGGIGIKGNPVSYQDGPHVWRKVGKGHWVYRGDTGGCLEKVPRAMLKAWKVERGC
ncbi:hypothetical protein ACIBHX_25660 [Nonomuraea sp. NPDC050536]|uniref:hypothetical protein n=1 Tax=Nonomuraea sp. NPDC050536 TaxID=3364366 RepID=UPI0037CA9052